MHKKDSSLSEDEEKLIKTLKILFENESKGDAKFESIISKPEIGKLQKTVFTVILVILFFRFFKTFPW